LVKIESAVRDCVGEAAAEDKLTSAAADFFGAHIAVLRIRAMRTGQWAGISQNECQDYNPKELRRLVALDRYERYALTKRRRASQQLLKE
jgi:hypothetical protein